MAIEGARVALAPAEATVAAPVTVNVLERVLGNNDLISVTFLESAVRAAKTVARIRIRSGQRTVGYGTGSLVAPNVLMTGPRPAREALYSSGDKDALARSTVSYRGDLALA